MVESFELDDHKTKSFRTALEGLNVSKTALIIASGENRNLELSLRNLKGVTLLPTRAVNPYHLLGHQSVFLSEAAARKFSEALAK